jgi:transposase InsO family protein
MPWTETCVMEERVKFIMDVLDATYCVTELCNYYGISRKTGYKWLARYNQGGLESLRNRSRAPLSHPHQISHQIKGAILAVKSRFPKWGAAKIRARLEREHPNWDSYPAISTIGLFLRNQNLTCPRSRRRKATPTEPPLTSGRYVNHVWCADFKGHFKTGNGSRCNPLTISDYASRYLLCCRHVDRMSYELVKMRFEQAFREYGLPEVIRTDNGTPFSSRGLGGLSRLSYWWIRLGIYPERIEPGHPEQNGRHERIHKTLKDYTARPAAMTLSAQQQRFNKFRKEYNEHRPHEALQMRVPSDCYGRSPREFPSPMPKVSYPGHMQVKRVQPHGDFIYKGKRLFATECLYGDYVGIEQIDADMSLLWYYNYLLGHIDHKKWQIIPVKPSRLSVQISGQISEDHPGKVLPMSSV